MPSLHFPYYSVITHYPFSPGTSATMSSKGKEPMDLSDLDSALGLISLSDLDSALASSIDVRIAIADELYRRLQDLANVGADLLEKFSPNVRKRVKILLEIQGQHDEHKREFLKEKAALEAKYQKIYEPLYAVRYEIVNGIMEVEGVRKEDMRQPTTRDTGLEGVPGFWLTAMKNNEALAKEIQKRDEEALKYLRDVKWCKTDEPKGFKLDFLFDTNPYFKNSILTKTYQMIDDNDRLLEKVFGSEIEWHPGKCLSRKIQKKRPKKGSMHAIPIKKIEKCGSFFKFFSPPEIPANDSGLDDGAEKKLQDQIQQDFDIALTFRDKIIPYAVLWFTGDAAQKTYFTDLGDKDDKEEEDKRKRE